MMFFRAQLCLIAITAFIQSIHSNFTHDEDIWSQIIGPGYMDNNALFTIMKTDKLRAIKCYETGIISKRKLEHNIKSVIKQLQRRFTLVQYQTFTTASADDLMTQYLYGFNGELLWLFAKINRNHRNSEETYFNLEEEFIQLKKLLRAHKQCYGQSKPVRFYKNVTDKKVIQSYDQFVSLQELSETLLSKMEFAFCEYFGNQTDSLQDIACLCKLMMQSIGQNIEFPGIMKMDRFHPKVVPLDNWQKLKNTFIGWKRILNDELAEDERFYARKVEFQHILRQIPEAAFFCNAMLVLLEKIFYAFL